MARKGENMICFGEFENKSGTIDVTDPCYDKDVWCRKRVVGVLTGTYQCFYHKGEVKNWGERIWSCRIVHKDHLDIVKKRPYKIGNVGVDAGLCGFFDDKPDYNDEEWAELCSKMDINGYPTNYMLPYGCFTSSGLGDGVYDFFAWQNEKGQIVALELRFI